MDMGTNSTTKTAGGKAHADIMSATDDAVYIVTLRGTSKIVRNGKTLARANAYTDGTFDVVDGTHRIVMPTWQSCAEFISSRAAMLAITAPAAYLVNFVPVAA